MLTYSSIFTVGKIVRIKGLVILLVLSVAPVAILLLLWPRHGLYAQYNLRTDAGELTVAETVDPSPFFAHRKIFQAPVLYRWDQAVHGNNDALPRLLVRWQGYLRVPEGGERHLVSDTEGAFSVRIVGKKFDVPRGAFGVRVDLPAGLYPFEAEYRGRYGPKLQWGALDDLKPITDGNFYRRKPVFGGAAAAVAAAIAMLLIQVVVLARLRPGASEALLDFLTAKGHWVALAVLLALVLFTRTVHLDRLPFPNETADEYNVALNGLNLVFEGVPSTWSQLPAYGMSSQRQILFGDAFTIVKPYFDHPPGFALLVGSYLRLTGVDFAKRYDHFFANRSRYLTVAVAILNAVLLFFLAFRVLHRRDLALLAVAWFALNPTAAYAGRLVKSENFLIAFLFGALLLAMRYVDTGRRRALVAAAVLAGLACVFKVTGVAVVGGVAAVLFVERRWRAGVFVLAVGAAFFATYFLYGAHYDWDLFQSVLQNQQTRQFGQPGHGETLSTRGLWSLVAMAGVAAKKYASLSHVWLWLAFFGFGMASQREQRGARLAYIVWPALVYLAVLGVTMGSDKSFGWYRIPLVPLFSVAAAWYVWRMIRDASAPLVAVFLLMPLVDALYWGALAPATGHPIAFRLAVIAPLGLLIAAQALPSARRDAAIRVLGVLAVVATFAGFFAAILGRWYIYTLQY
jgi:4-amino-4-deoxy-L-arabinose transferase-like glycosyltransferase